MKSIQVRWSRYVRRCWRSRDELISDVLLWTPSHGCAKVGWSARTYIQQLCAKTGCSLEDLPEVMDNREGWQERVRDICADGVTWWWWWANIFAEIWFLGLLGDKPQHRNFVATSSYHSAVYCWSAMGKPS